MKQQTEQLTKDIIQMTTYKPDKPTDLFQYYHPQIRKQFIDAYNLCRIWVEGLLYWKALYPQQAFEVKTAYSMKVYIVRSKLLRDYLDRFFESVCQNFQYIHFIEIQIYEQDNQPHNERVIVQAQRFYMSFSQKLSNLQDLHEVKRKGVNTIQKQIEYKRFLGKMQQQLNKGYYYRPQNRKVSFELLMGYKWEHRNKNNKHRVNLLNKWTQVEQNGHCHKRITNQAETGELEIRCERMTPQITIDKSKIQDQK